MGIANVPHGEATSLSVDATLDVPQAPPIVFLGTMREVMRDGTHRIGDPTPLPHANIGDARVAATGHVVQLYESDEFLSGAITRFVATGMARGERVVLFVTPPHADMIRAALSAEGHDVDRACRDGSLAFLDASDALGRIMVDQMPDPDFFAEHVGSLIAPRASGDGAPHVRAFGEMVDVLCKRGNASAALRLEQLWNDLARTRPLSLMCGYDLAGFPAHSDAAHFDRICHQHAEVYPTETCSELTTAEERLREIATLQQRARALEAEVARYRSLENALRSVIVERDQALSRVEQLQSITASFAKASAPSDVARAVVNQGTAALGAPGGAVWLRSEDGSTLELVHQLGLTPTDRAAYAHLPLSDNSDLPIAHCVRDGVAVWVESRAAFAERYPRCAAASESTNDVAFCCVPLVAGGACLGAISMAFDRPRVFDEDERRFVGTIAHHCAQALDRARLFDEAQRAHREAESMNRMKDEFLGTVSHELRTPLNAILGWATILQTRSDVDVKTAVDTIERNARAQGRLIEDVLDASRIISGKLTIAPATIDLASVLRAAILVVTPAAMAKEIALDVTIDTEPCPFFGDADRLQQVFWNLLSNAVKFTPRSGRIVARLSRPPAQGTVEITVRDNGRGVRPDFLPHMFERFRQADRSSTRSERGLGLGLAIVRYLTELHGGTVHAESGGEGRGATFTVSLPIRAVSLASPDQPMIEPADEASDGARRETANRLEGLRVLVCDDDDDARGLLVEVLRPAGAAVCVAASVREALEKFRTERPHVIVSDIGLPGVDGYSLLRQVRALPSSDGGQTPAIALTAYAADKDVRAALSAGYQRHMVKPIEPSDLIEMLASLAEPRG